MVGGNWSGRSGAVPCLYDYRLNARAESNIFCFFLFPELNHRLLFIFFKNGFMYIVLFP